MKELSSTNEKLETEIVSKTEHGNALADIGKHAEALKFYAEAWSMLPPPKEQWEMLPSWIAGSCFNSYFEIGEFDMAKEWAKIALETRSSQIDTGPIVNLGMAYHELGNEAEAFHHFEEAYSYGRERAFKERPKKYLDFYLSKKKDGK